MDEVAKYAKTLDEIEGELMFGGEIPDDLSDDGSNIFDDEYDAANDETFGGPVNDVVDAELEDYAAQTARLRLDDPVWQNPTSSAAPPAPEACQIPMPSFNPMSMFGTGVVDVNLQQNMGSYLDKSIWGSEVAASPSYNIWASDFGLGNLQQQLPPEPEGLGDLSSLLGDDNTQYVRENKSPNLPIPAMPTTALTLDDLEKWHSTPENLVSQFQGLQIQNPVAPPSKVVLQDLQAPPPPVQIPVPIQKPEASPALSSAYPEFPKTALSLEEIERQLIRETQQLSLSPKIIAKPPSPVVQQHLPQVAPLPQIPLEMLSQYLPQQQMIPQLPPMLPRLPPLNPMYLQFVPIWITHIMHQGTHPLPMNVPPPPPFLFQLMQFYRNPHLVSQMIIQSSIPPQPSRLTTPHPGSAPQSPMNKFQRKTPGMPSSRTIQDLAYDSFAGYMSWKEREWLVKIQMMQCKGSGDPQVEDYYYTTWREKQIANGWVPAPKSEKPKELESRSDYMERTRRINYREMQKERATVRHKEREKEKSERMDEKRPKLTLSEKFASSLGLPSKSSTANPRHLIDMKKQADSAENSTTRKLTDEERKIAVAKKLRTMLIRLEGALVLLLDIDEFRSSSKHKELSAAEKESEVEERVSLIINELMGDDLHKLLQMSKGRTVITKTLRAAGTKDQARIILALMSAGGLVNKKMYTEIVLEVLPSVYSTLASLHPDQFELLVQALSMDTLKRQFLDSNVFIRDMMITMFLISERNGQNLLEWAYATKFPSLALPEKKSLVYWRKALKVVGDEEMRRFAQAIKDSEIREFEQVHSLILTAV